MRIQGLETAVHLNAGALGKPSTKAQKELEGVDQAVKAHEQAHLSVLGGYAAGPIQFEYLIGADGSRYAVGGSVKVDLSPVPGNPEETIRKAQAIQRSAFAPGNSSGADLRVAAEAYRMEAEARAEITQRDAEAASDRDDRKDSPREAGARKVRIGWGPFDQSEDLGRLFDSTV